MLRIALFDYKIVRTNPIGGCHLRMIRDLCHDHAFTVFAVEFENPCPQRVRWVRIPAPTRPLALLFISFHLLAPLFYLWHRWRHRQTFDLLQMVESNLGFGDVSYTQFCHRAYLRNHFRSSGMSGLRGAVRWLDHRLHALVEPWVFRSVGRIVVPSAGLARELRHEYPEIRDKIHVLPNPVDTALLQRPPEFDRADFRRQLGAAPQDVCLVFSALGHFERKGLPVLLQALRSLASPKLRLIVLGGTPDLVSVYRARVEQMGLASNVFFAGMQSETRPYLWAADAFVFPSSYETFSLVSFEAAASGLPILAASLYGVEDFLKDGENGILLERSVEGVVQGLRRLLSLPTAALPAMGLRAKAAVTGYGTERFSANWREFYGGAHVG